MRNRVNCAFLTTLITLAWMTCQAKGQTNSPTVSNLSPPFTLTYALVVRHPNAKQLDAPLLNCKMQQYDWQVKQGTMTRQQAIQMLNALANSSTPQQEHHRIVLSCNTKGRLLYQDNNEEDHTSNFVLKLVRASPTALSDQLFNLKTWLPHLPPNSGRIIYLMDYRSNLPIQVSYAYQPGSMDEIIAKARRNGQVQKQCTPGNPSCSLRFPDHHRGAAYTYTGYLLCYGVSSASNVKRKSKKACLPEQRYILVAP